MLDQDLESYANGLDTDVGSILKRILTGDIVAAWIDNSILARTDEMIKQAYEGERLTSQYKYVRDYDVG